MTKSERLVFIKRRFKELDELEESKYKSDAVLPVTNIDIIDEASLMDTYREYIKDLQSQSDALTSDEY